MRVCDFEAWVHRRVNPHSQAEETETQHNGRTERREPHACGRARAHTKLSQRHSGKKQTSSPRSHIDLDSCNAFQGAAATQTDEAGRICQSHGVTLALK